MKVTKREWRELCEEYFASKFQESWFTVEDSAKLDALASKLRAVELRNHNRARNFASKATIDMRLGKPLPSRGAIKRHAKAVARTRVLIATYAQRCWGGESTARMYARELGFEGAKYW